MNRENKKKKERPLSSTFKIMATLIRIEMDKEDIRKNFPKLVDKELLLEIINRYAYLLKESK